MLLPEDIRNRPRMDQRLLLVLLGAMFSAAIMAGGLMLGFWLCPFRGQ